MSHVFVSHATKDDPTVSRIHDELETLTGKNLWVDHKDLKPPESNYRQALHDALNECEAGLLVLSRQTIGRDEIMAEWNYVLTMERDLFVAKIDDIGLKDINPRLLIVQWVDLSKDWDKGIQALAAYIQGKTPPADAPLTLIRPISGRIDRRLTTIPISGRDEDLKVVQSLLKRGPTAILGVGGLGKSRLAAEVVVTGDQRGAIWHTIGQFSRADEVLDLLREHFELDKDTPRHETLAKLRGAKRLVVLDNAEAVPSDDPRRPDYAQLVDDLQAAGAQTLLTSRVEWDDLQICYSHTPPPLSQEAARQIVLDMAATFAIQYDLTAYAASLGLLAKQHPRLIEWAVKLMRKFTPDKMMEDLKTLKSQKAQDALDEMILKTIRQMSEVHGEQAAAALRRLNVCRGGFTYEAAQAVLQAASRDEADAWLATLQTWQFVSLQGQRYGIDPLVIAAVGEDEAAREAHFAYYEGQHGDYETNNNEDRHPLIQADFENIQAALNWGFALTPRPPLPQGSLDDTFK